MPSPDDKFRAVVVRESGGEYVWRIEHRRIVDLPAGDLLVKVEYSSLNYKDALSATGHKGVTGQYPHTPGIDAAGTVVESDNPGWQTGQEVIVTGHDLGQNTPGGWGEYIRVPADWAVPLPEGMSPREAMAIGTAGFTAAQCVKRLVDHGVDPDDGDILVTGATGGVGCLAVNILADRGYTVAAGTGKPDRENWLRRLGAERVVGREETVDYTGRPLLSSRWAAAVDTVGGDFLATALRSTSRRGIVAACGNAGGAELEMTVYPFILRGVTLAGIDSAACPPEARLELWSLLAGAWKPSALDRIAVDVDLDELSERVDLILRGGVCGRVVVRHGD